MEYTNEQLSSIEEYAGYFMPISDIAVLLGLDADSLRTAISSPNSQVSEVYRRGKALTKLALRQNEITLAKNASPLAVELAEDYLIEMERDENF